jgi:hypothetical protein
MGAQLDDVQFKEASWDWVQNLPTDTTAATTKWGDIGDWDVSAVADFSYAFSKHRDKEGGKKVNGGNPQAASFVGTGISKWNTVSATSLYYTFAGAGAMNADISGWKVDKVTTLGSTFNGASKFVGTGLDKWNIANVWASGQGMTDTFLSALSLNGCEKRKIAYMWAGICTDWKTAWDSCDDGKSHQWLPLGYKAFSATTYPDDWAADVCPIVVRRTTI